MQAQDSASRARLNAVLEPSEALAQRLPLLDVLQLARVSRAWREQLGRPMLTERVAMKDCQRGERRASATAWLLKNLHRTRDLELVQWGSHVPLPPQLLTAAPVNSLTRLSFDRCRASALPSLATCTALKELRIIGSYAEDLPTLDAMTEQLTRLEVVNNDHLKSLPTSLARCTALEALTVTKPKPFNKQVLSKSMVLLPQLTALKRLGHLQLGCCKIDAALGPPGLRVLDLADCDVENSQLLGLTACTGLEELSIDSYCDTDGTHLPQLAALGELRRLSLRWYRRERFPSLAGLTRLTSLKLMFCYLGSTEQQVPLLPLADLTSLVELDLYDISGVRQLPSLASCEQLQVLKFDTMYDLQALPDLSGCTQLKTLLFVDCMKLQRRPDLAACMALEKVSFSAGGEWSREEYVDLNEWIRELRSRGIEVEQRQFCAPHYEFYEEDYGSD